MTLGYIWTALTQHIKPGVPGRGGGGGRDPRWTDDGRTRPAHMGHAEGTWKRCSLFWLPASN